MRRLLVFAMLTAGLLLAMRKIAEKAGPAIRERCSEMCPSITVAADVYQKLRAGNVDPPQAFLDGKIKVDGDMQLTMQLALAAVAPD